MDDKDIPQHWLYTRGSAPNFSRAVALASKAVDEAEEKLRQELKRSYPMGARVQVFHYKGSFFGRVVGWDTHGIRVAVHNDRSRKMAKWWAAQVQLAEEI